MILSIFSNQPEEMTATLLFELLFYEQYVDLLTVIVLLNMITIKTCDNLWVMNDVVLLHGYKE